MKARTDVIWFSVLQKLFKKKTMVCGQGPSLNSFSKCDLHWDALFLPQRGGNKGTGFVISFD